MNEAIRQETWFGHPKGLYVLFFVEMWERFCYYGMRSILIYYMIKQLMFAQERASYIYGLYTSAAYFFPFFGGILADRILGQKKTVIIGASIMAVGEFVLMSQDLFYVGLALMALGTGLFKPNVSTQVGTLYDVGDHRRDRAFNIFYMGINLGAIMSPLICGTLGELYGWKWGFMSAGIGLILGLIVYIWGQKYLKTVHATEGVVGQVSEVTKMTPLTKKEKDRIVVLFICFLMVIIFWGAFEQAGGLLNLYALDKTDRVLFGWAIPTSWFQSLNPIFIVVFGTLVANFWYWYRKIGKETSSIYKMALGTMIMGSGFIFMIFASLQAGVAGKASMIWLVLAYLFFTIGELCASPVALSFITKIAPIKYASLMMGLYFAVTGLGNKIAGLFGEWAESSGEITVFGTITILTMIIGVIVIIFLKPLKRLTHGAEEGCLSDEDAESVEDNNSPSELVYDAE